MTTTELTRRLRDRIAHARAVYSGPTDTVIAVPTNELEALIDAYEGATRELAALDVEPQPAPPESDEELRFVKDAEEQTEEK